jgi:MFS family permease
VLIGGIVLGLVLGLAAGGRLSNLALVRLRWPGLVFAAVIVRFGTEAALNAHIDAVVPWSWPLLLFAYALLIIGLWANRRQPGFGPAIGGIVGNGLVFLVNGGHMVVWEPALRAAGFTPADLTPIHRLLPPPVDATFLLHAGPLGDVIPVPLPIIGTVASPGDVLLAAGLAFFCFATLVGGGVDTAEAASLAQSGLAASARLPRALAARLAGTSVQAETGLTSGLTQVSLLRGPMILAGSAPGTASVAVAPIPDEASAAGSPAGLAPSGAIRAAGVPAGLAPAALAGLLERARRHPYIRLALNSSFSALWVGQLVSLFGDRIHQVALAFLVLDATNSPIAVGLVFVAATLPNLLLGPVAGTLVDRWNHQHVMVASDLLRAAAVFLIPVAAETNLWLVYPLVFAVTAISIFFRPARTAVIPRIVAPEELMAANSATWIGETLADIGGYPLAGVFVAFLGAALPLAFWLDGISYLASAILITTMAIPPVLRTDVTGRLRLADLVADLVAGWRFLRRELVLLANTLQGVVGQFTIGALLTIAPIYARDQLVDSVLDPSTRYALLETGIGVGNLVGGFVIGLLGARLAKGRLVILGYASWGLLTAALAFTGALPVALALMVGSGIANMVFVIPSQTLFQERTPPQLMGRVVGFRFALVFGSMTLAMAVAGVAAEWVGLGPVLVVFGLVTTAAGLAGLLVPAVRNA